MISPEPLRVAVLGTGMIGMDLVHKIHRSALLDCELVAGRNPRSAGLARAAELGCPVSSEGIEAVLAAARPFDVVFDATNAHSHIEHWRRLEPLDTLLIDLTPSKIGQMVVPTVTGTRVPAHRNISLISCGGQASVPIVHALARRFPTRYLEVVTTVASDIAGRATRLNLDEFVMTTQQALSVFSGVADTKAIINISPAVPPATFRVAISAEVPDADAAAVHAVVAEAAEQVRTFAPGYAVTACTVVDERVSISVEVSATSEVMPRHAGNLDIINAAAILVAEQYAAARDSAAMSGVAL
ncbi:acetaldehyde dehydrogenase (acetylating) [Nocardia sp. CDC159]|uniref:Acetaldehyde dehydrogenase n=1 Tax=Nocardia pulmonis TaxID=2951408 RepID=A0A9X2IZM0_9NOCA|nr:MULTISPECIES: acetaldehyde dehydrogenase (acetylating) [Nocardia]MCM6778222.1 acetaldehyde dehydrogenase (acetylating) [Nocardia pulmonis]MCM6791111.1 acetaldehyde dehydrogenase (acetylating) [Nocardia sp. CDC159]